MAAADAAIAVCEKHIKDTNSENTEIEAYLVRYLLTLISAEFEEVIEALVRARAERSGDSELVSFVTSATSQLFRTVRIGEVAGLIGRFGMDLKDKFSAQVNNTPAHNAFDSIVSNRLQVAHTTGAVQLTLPELRMRYDESKAVIRAMATTLGVSAPY